MGCNTNEIAYQKYLTILVRDVTYKHDKLSAEDIIKKINSKLTKAGFGDKQILSSDAKGYANLKNRIAVRKNEKIWEKYETPKLFSLTDIERSLD